MFLTFPDLCLWLVWSKSKYFIMTQPRVALQHPRVPWALWGWAGSWGYPSLAGQELLAPSKSFKFSLSLQYPPRRMRHTLVLQEMKIPALVWLGEARQESEFHFPASCPWVYFNISSSCSEGQQSGSWESTKEELANFFGFFFFFGLPKLAKPAKN